MILTPSTVPYMLYHYLKDLRERGDGWMLGVKMVNLQTPYGFTGVEARTRLLDLYKGGALEKRKLTSKVEYRAKLDWKPDPPRLNKQQIKWAKEDKILSDPNELAKYI